MSCPRLTVSCCFRLPRAAAVTWAHLGLAALCTGVPDRRAHIGIRTRTLEPRGEELVSLFWWQNRTRLPPNLLCRLQHVQRSRPTVPYQHAWHLSPSGVHRSTITTPWVGGSEPPQKGCSPKLGVQFQFLKKTYSNVGGWVGGWVGGPWGYPSTSLSRTLTPRSAACERVEPFCGWVCLFPVGRRLLVRRAPPPPPEQSPHLHSTTWEAGP